MTDQLHDHIVYKGIRYGIDSISGEKRIFCPEKYGFKPKAWCTGCWRGFICTYEIMQDLLYLNQLLIYDESDNYPPLNGITPSEKNGSASIYKNIQLPIKFSGHIAIGTDFRWANGIGRYQDLYTLLFDKGRLIKSMIGKPAQIDFHYLN